VIAIVGQPDVNTLLIVGVAIFGLIFGPRAWSRKVAEAREHEMQRTIETYKDRVESLEGEVTSLRDDVTQCHAAAAQWEARYREMVKYAAPEALEAVRAEMAATRVAVVTAIEAQGELVMKNTELVASLSEKRA
jgi:cell division protein FtsB